MSASQLRLHMRVEPSVDRGQGFSKLPSGPEVQSWLRRTTSVELAQGSVINLVLPGSVLIQSRSHCFSPVRGPGDCFTAAWVQLCLHCVLLVTVRRDERARWWESQRVSRTSESHREAISESSHCDWAAEEVLCPVGVTDDVWAAWRFYWTCVCWPGRVWLFVSCNNMLTGCCMLVFVF